MDNLTHGLLGAAVGMLRRREGGPENDAPLTPTDKAAVWSAFIASELPDIDVFFTTDPLASLELHRGWTHGLLVAPVGAAIAATVTKLFWREARFGTLYAWSLASLVGVHLLPDWLTGWGTQLLQPFSQAKAALDWVPIIDWVVLLALIPAVLVAWKRPHLRRKVAAGVLAFVALFWLGYRGTAHQLVQAKVAARHPGQHAVRLSVSPDLFNPLKWRYTVDNGYFYEQGEGYPWRLSPEMQASPKVHVLGSVSDDKVVDAVRAAPELAPFFRHFKFPVISYAATESGWQVTLEDVRYRMAGRGMAYTVLLDRNLNVTAVSDGGF